MNVIPTTFRLPMDLHEELRAEAFRSRMSLNELAVARLRGKHARVETQEVRLKTDFALFDEVARSGVAFDAAKAIREERDRDHA